MGVPYLVDQNMISSQSHYTVLDFIIVIVAVSIQLLSCRYQIYKYHYRHKYAYSIIIRKLYDTDLVYVHHDSGLVHVCMGMRVAVSGLQVRLSIMCNVSSWRRARQERLLVLLGKVVPVMEARPM